MKSNNRTIELGRVLRHIDKPHLARSSFIPSCIIELKEKGGKMTARCYGVSGKYDPRLKSINWNTPYIAAELSKGAYKRGTIKEVREWVAHLILSQSRIFCGRKKRDCDWIMCWLPFRGRVFDGEYPPPQEDWRTKYPIINRV